MPQISVILPSTGRKERLLNTLSTLKTTLHPEDEIIAVIDADDDSLAAALRFKDENGGQMVIDYCPERRGVKAWNDGLRKARGEYIVLAADDLVFQAGWRDEALKVMHTLPESSGLVAFNDGHHDGNALGTHYMMARSFIIDHMGGRIVWDCYKHSFQDVEANARAKRAGRYAWAKDAHVTHDHWNFGTRPKDATDNVNIVHYDDSARAYHARAAADFPDDYPAIIGPKAENGKRRIGWLIDHSRYQGGAEMAASELAATAPANVVIVPCPPGGVSVDVDAYVVHNCTQYSAADIKALKQHPVYKVVHDVWPHGDPTLRNWFLANSKLVMLSSPLHREALPYDISAPVRIAPMVAPTAPFIEAARSANGHRKGYCWIGRMWPGKGLERAMKWAADKSVTIDFYGYGPGAEFVQPPHNYKGTLQLAEVPGVLAKYETFVFLPNEVEPYSRTTVEAWLAGCKLVVNKNIGALHWIQNDPDAIFSAAAKFWEAVND